VEPRIPDARVVRFAMFEVDLRSGEVRQGGVKLKLSGQPFQVLAILLEQPGEPCDPGGTAKAVVATFVNVDHNLNTAINKIREVLGDEAENPRFVETLPRRGYRFIALWKKRGPKRLCRGGVVGRGVGQFWSARRRYWLERLCSSTDDKMRPHHPSSERSLA
jgi:DNA-binding winged helix-turn-helix (wHTH) protein